MITESGLEALQPWIEGYLARLSPARRLVLSRRIGQRLRRQNAERVRRNVQPDGSAMAPRAASKRKRKRRGPMFKKIALNRNTRVRARPDEVELFFAPRVSGAAAVHHYGLVDKVENRPNSIRTRYPARRLLGFGPADPGEIMDEVLAFFEG